MMSMHKSIDFISNFKVLKLEYLNLIYKSQTHESRLKSIKETAKLDKINNYPRKVKKSIA